MAYRDSFTATRLPDKTWRVVMHGFKSAEFFGATAAEALANAGKVTDLSVEAIDRFYAKEAAAENKESNHG